MKILHINSYYSSSFFYKNLYEKQRQTGMDIDVYVPIPQNFNTKELKLGEYTTIRKNHGKYDRFLFHLKHMKIYKDIVSTYDINKYFLLHAHSLFSNGYIAYRLKKEYKIPYIVAVRNTDINVFFKYMVYLRRLGVEILKEADKVIFLSKAYRDFLISKYIPKQYKERIREKSEIIPNGIDYFWLQNKGEPKKIFNSKKINVLTVGIVCKSKNQLTTAKTIDILDKRGYDIHYTIVGKVKDKSVYERIKNLSYVQYIPHVTKEKLIDIYRKNDIFIMPSRTETFGLVYPEAMSQGLPVIYTRGQGFDGQFKEGEVGYSVDSMDVEDIASKIIRISNDYSEISKRCIKLANKFDWNKIANMYEMVYLEML